MRTRTSIARRFGRPGVVMIAVAGLFVATTGAPAGALGKGPACRPFAAVKARVHVAATRREGTLDVLVAALQARRDPWSMNAGQIGALQGARSDVAALDSHVQGACYATVSALRSDVTPLFTGFRVYWLRVPQSRGIEVADRLGEARARIGAAASALASHVGSNAKAEQDLAAMNGALAAADARLGVAPSPAAHIAALPTLAPAQDMTADVAAMEAARADLIAARTSLVEARADGLAVVADLGG